MSVLGQLINAVLTIYLMTLFARMILSWVPAFVRDWQPRGVMLVVAEAIYTVTDPPIRFVGKFIPPLRMGNASLDLGFMVVAFLVLILIQINAILL